LNSAIPISLEFTPETSLKLRARISYAFRVFAAIYGHPVVDAENSSLAIPCFYGDVPSRNARPDTFYIPALYWDVEFEKPLHSAAKHRYANEEVYLSFGIEARQKRPDWLGEIFLWLSSGYEAGIRERDAIGRIPYSQTIFNTAEISVRKPHAAILMAWMENELRRRPNGDALPAAPSPFPIVTHAVISSHDLDFYLANRLSTLARLTKNLAIALTTYRSWDYFVENSRMILQLLRGKPIGDFLPSLIAASAHLDFCSTLFAVSRHGDRRDPDYRLGNISARLAEAARRGFSVGLHGSYRSVMEDRSLRLEAQVLAAHSYSAPIANRQHWLRFCRHADLFQEIERAELFCDSSLGFPDAVGFRNGASFAFPPYDFANERPHRFLEIPLILMDGSVEAVARTLRADPQQLAEEVLGESRKYGWGGISILWHNPIEPLSVPSEINQVFWNCAKQQKQFGESWMSVDQFFQGCIERYHNAGLLEGVNVDGQPATHERSVVTRTQPADIEGVQPAHIGPHSH
jgi:hypothetical protein